MHRLSICCLPLTAKILRNKEEWDMVPGANVTFCSFHNVIDWHPCYEVAGSVPSPMKMSGILWLFHPTEHEGSDDTYPLTTQQSMKEAMIRIPWGWVTWRILTLSIGTLLILEASHHAVRKPKLAHKEGVETILERSMQIQREILASPC